jgi:hypothetical protein
MMKRFWESMGHQIYRLLLTSLAIDKRFFEKYHIGLNIFIPGKQSQGKWINAPRHPAK